MPRIGNIQAASWRTTNAPLPSAIRLLTPNVPRDPGSTAPAGTGRVWGPGLLGVSFTTLADRAQRIYQDDNTKLDAVSMELILAAEKLLDAHGVRYSHTKTTDGYFALQIEPGDDQNLLNDPAYDLSSKLGGFRLLYSPGKLIARGSNGDHWRFTRELCLAHQSIQDMRLDPVTVHEMEHTVLSRAEEKGIPQLLTGCFQSNPGGSIPTDTHGIGGYVGYLSIQEVSAYSEQCYVHANRIRDVDFITKDAVEVEKLREASSWGTALAQRVGNIAEELEGVLARRPPVHAKLDDVDVIVGADGEVLDTTDAQLGEHVRIERFPLTIQPFGKEEPFPVSQPRVFVQIRGMPYSTSVPLPQAEAAVHAGDYTGVRDQLGDHFTRLKDACRKLEGAFKKVWDETKRLENTRPLERQHLDTLVNDILALRDLTKSLTWSYRVTFDPPPG